MVAGLAGEGGIALEQVPNFLEAFGTWAACEAGLLAAGLCGSQARGDARADSDVDLVLIARDPEGYLADRHWAEAFGRVENLQEEGYGRVTSLRVWYTGGLEVEFALCGADWAAWPADAGTRAVLEGGFRILLDKEGLLARLTDEVFGKKAG